MHFFPVGFCKGLLGQLCRPIGKFGLQHLQKQPPPKVKLYEPYTCPLTQGSSQPSTAHHNRRWVSLRHICCWVNITLATNNINQNDLCWFIYYSAIIYSCLTYLVDLLYPCTAYEEGGTWKFLASPRDTFQLLLFLSYSIFQFFSWYTYLLWYIALPPPPMSRWWGIIIPIIILFVPPHNIFSYLFSSLPPPNTF